MSYSSLHTYILSLLRITADIARFVAVVIKQLSEGALALLWLSPIGQVVFDLG